MSKGTKTVVAKKVAAKPTTKAAPKAAAKPAAKPVVKAAAPAKKAAPAAKSVKAAPKAAAPKKVTKEVVADCPLATTVCIAGTFNNWMVDVDMMKKDKKTGLWKIKLELVPGDYEYKFVCDGKNWDVGDNKIMHV